jgi:hypothetical protein
VTWGEAFGLALGGCLALLLSLLLTEKREDRE